MRPKALFVGGTLNMTSQVHAVARELPEFDAYFSPYFGDGVLGVAARARLLEATSLGHKQRRIFVAYAERHGLALDVEAARGPYALVVTASDVVIPKRLRNAPLVGVQEGMLDPELFWFHARRLFRFLPRWAAGTAYTGTSNACDRFCVASEGFRAQMIARGADPARLVVTGIPNFDDSRALRARSFRLRDFVLACTSDGRETLKWDDRRRFARKVARIAAGRPILVKLHPNENAERARREFARWLPSAEVVASGDTLAMIACCATLVVEWSSTALVGLALGKEVHSNFSDASLRALVPLLDDGQSAVRIADVCREVVTRRRRALGCSERGARRSSQRAAGATKRTEHTMDLKSAVSKRDHVRGGAEARVTLVEYGDFDCPFCAEAYPVVKALLARFGADLRFVFRHNPRGELHPNAHRAAQAAEAAALQGQFWQMHDALFEHAKRLDANLLPGYAKAIGLDVARFETDLTNPAVKARVKDDEIGGLESGVIGTPTFFIDGKHFRDKPDLDTLTRAIQAELAHHAARHPSAPPHEFHRRDGSGHLDPAYAAKLRAETGHARGRDDARAFLGRPRSAEGLSEQLGEEFVETVTSAQDEGEEVFNQIVPEESGGPFVETSADTEFAHGTDASNIKGATREPFPKT